MSFTLYYGEYNNIHNDNDSIYKSQQLVLENSAKISAHEWKQIVHISFRSAREYTPDTTRRTDGRTDGRTERHLVAMTAHLHQCWQQGQNCQSIATLRHCMVLANRWSCYRTRVADRITLRGLHRYKNTTTFVNTVTRVQCDLYNINA